MPRRAQARAGETGRVLCRDVEEPGAGQVEIGRRFRIADDDDLALGRVEPIDQRLQDRIGRIDRGDDDGPSRQGANRSSPR